MVAVIDIHITRTGGDPTRETHRIIGKDRMRILGKWIRGQKTPGFDFWHAPPCSSPNLIRSLADIHIDPRIVDYYWYKNGVPRSRKI